MRDRSLEPPNRNVVGGIRGRRWNLKTFHFLFLKTIIHFEFNHYRVYNLSTRAVN